MIRAIEEVIMEFKVGERVRVVEVHEVEVHEDDGFYGSRKDLIGKQGIIIRKWNFPNKGYFAGVIKFNFGIRFFHAVKLEKVEDK